MPLDLELSEPSTAQRATSKILSFPEKKCRVRPDPNPISFRNLSGNGTGQKPVSNNRERAGSVVDIFEDNFRE